MEGRGRNRLVHQRSFESIYNLSAMKAVQHPQSVRSSVVRLPVAPMLQGRRVGNAAIFEMYSALI